MNHNLQKIVIVGNSSNLLQHENGDIINSFDYVVRMGMCRTIGYEINVGSKTNLLCGFVNDFIVPHYRENKIVFQPKIYASNCDHLLFLEHEYDEYKEFTQIGNLWGIGYLPISPAAAGEYYFKFFNSKQFQSFFQTKKFSECVFFNFVKQALYNEYNIKKISFYDKASRIKVFTSYNQQLVRDRMYMPSKGMYILDYVIKTFPNAEIFVTGFDGMKTKNYWRKDDTPFWVTHSSSHEMLMYKKLLRTGRIQEL